MNATTALIAPKSAGDELVDSVHHAMKSVFRTAHPALTTEGISMGQFWALHMISSLDVASLSTIARGLGVSSPTICAQVDELEAAGFVARQRSERDRRIVELSLTTKGRRAEARVWARIGQTIGQAVRGVPSEDLETTIRVFRTIYEKLDGPSGRTGGRA
jgi:DNA-binding MarR family transcriptional regulator